MRSFLVVMVALCNKTDHYIFMLVCSSFFFSRLISAIVCLPYFHTYCGLSANLRCRSETCCTRLAENTGRKKSPKIAIWTLLHNFVGYIFATKARIDSREKLVKQQYVLHMSPQYGELRPTSGLDRLTSLG